MRNAWEYWRPIYKYTWAIAQRSSYHHFGAQVQTTGKTVLDIGTGSGVYIKHLPKGNHYIFTDLDADALVSAEQEARKHLGEGNFTICQGDAQEVLRKFDSVDVISFLHVIAVLPQPEQILQRAYASLKPHGKLLVYISRFSKPLAQINNPLVQRLGFHLLNLSKMPFAWSVQRVGLLNDCYVYEKSSL